MSESTTEPAQAPRRDSVGAGDSAEPVSLACLPSASYHCRSGLNLARPGALDRRDGQPLADRRGRLLASGLRPPAGALAPAGRLSGGAGAGLGP